MCGLVGFLVTKGFDHIEASAILGTMTDSLTHRGPDDSGQWLDGVTGIALGHRRLAIIDLSPAGHQPLISESGRFVLAFNGEIYNHLELRRKLGLRRWRGHSDTETLLALIELWGLRRTLQQATGMFAVALWDKETRSLFLGRDRMGEKPLYYGWQGRTFLFGSELKALREHPEFRDEIDRSALALYVRRGYVPTPLTIYTGIKKLIPGSILEISSRAMPGDSAAPESYWSLKQIVASAKQSRFHGEAKEAVENLEGLLKTAIAQQQISDVPLGAFLSGGTDSSTVVAIMQSMSPVPVKTFTIGFEEQAYNEATYARRVAAHLGTDHTELYVSAQDAMGIIPDLPTIYDEPFADSSQIPTALVSRLARQHVTVSLSGDGGDELFCGYGHYERVERMWNRLSVLPLFARSAIRRLLPQGALAEGIASHSLETFYGFMNSQWKGYPDLVAGAKGSFDEAVPVILSDAKERLMYVDTLNYLPDDILVKVDRAAMSTSLETRMPFLHHRVVEFAWRLPIEMKFRNGVAKWPLKAILKKYIPEHVVDRPKMGFGVPIHKWLRGPLREWAEELLAEGRLERDGFFDSKAVREEWKLHLSEKRDRHYGLWTVLMFQAWQERACARS